MKLQIFNGGLSTRLAPHLISGVESVVFSNVRQDEATLAPVKKRNPIGMAIEKYAAYFITKSEWVSSAINRDYVEYQERLYWTEDNSIPQVYDGTNTYDLGISPPGNIPTTTIGVAGSLTGTYRYLYTYYSSSTGVESGVSFISPDLVATADKIDITNLTPSADPQVTHIRLYRIGGTLSKFTLVVTLNNSTTAYTDDIADTAVQGNILESVDYLQAKSGAKYLIEAYAILFYALGDKLYFSEIGRPWAWPEESFIDFPLPITGIGVVNNGLLIFTDLQTYIVTGNSPATFSRYPLSSSQGCKSHKTIDKIDNTLFWLSNDGICASTGGSPKVISRPKLGRLKLDPIVSVIHDDVYYLQHTMGSLVYDIRFNPVYKDLNLGNSYLVEGNDQLFGYFDDKYHELFTGEGEETLEYLSPVFLDGAFTNRKSYKTFYVRSKGQVDITIIVDGKEVRTWNLTTEDTHDLDIPQHQKNKYSVQFKISGTGTVFEIDYNPYGRTR